MSQVIQVIANRVAKDEADTMTINRQIGYRAQELAEHGRAGYALAHTATIDGPEFVTFVDTLTRDVED
ncbi:hypothetical protein AB0O90_17230 [Microbacterium testaceum]|uniref:hypothetical protein n=1 Tax=Microbacterium testaceum TaxID=2033 RepID=UPI003448C37C